MQRKRSQTHKLESVKCYKPYIGHQNKFVKFSAFVFQTAAYDKARSTTHGYTSLTYDKITQCDISFICKA
jgi:hypothetical protein